MTALYTASRKDDQPLPLKRYILLFANNLIKLSVQIAVIFFYSRFLPIDDYGRYQTVWLFVNILSVITLFGLPNLILTYAVVDINNWLKNNKRAIVAYVLTLLGLLLIYLFSQRVIFSWQITALLLVLIIAQNLAIIAETLSIKRSADTKVVIVNIIASILFLSSHIIIFKIGYSLPLLLISLLAIQVIKFAALFTFEQSGNATIVRVDFGRQWLYLGLIDSLSVIYKWLDKWIILFFISVSQFAIYFNGSYEIPVFVLMVSAVRNVLLVELAKDRLHDLINIRHLFTNTTLLLAAIVFPAFSFLLFYHQTFFLLFFGEKYTEAIPIFLMSIFVIPLRITSFTALLQLKHRNDLVLMGVCVDLALAILFMLLLYPWLGLPGIALAFVLSSYLQAIFYVRKTLAVTNLALSDIVPLRQLCVLLIFSLVITGVLHVLLLTYMPGYTLVAGIAISIALSITLLGLRRSKMLRII